MDLPIEIITMDSLMKRWNMSFNDIFLIVLNHDLAPVYSKYPDADWKKYGEDPEHDIFDVFLQNDKDPSRIVFLRSDVKRLEEKCGGQISESTDVLREQDLIERWGISKIEFWNLQEECSLPVVDPLGVEFKDYSTLDLHLMSYPEYRELGFYFRLSDLECLKKKYEINPKIDLMVKKGRKPRPSQIHKEQCRKVAKELWGKNSDITITKMIERKEMLAVSMKDNGKYYMEKTVRDWIKDLCPNRSPGRRPKKK